MKNFTLLCTSILISITGLYAQDKTKALEFDGVDDHVLIPHSAALNLGRSEFTIEAWIKADTGNNGTLAPIVLSKKGSGSNSNGYMFGLDDKGRIALQLKGVNFGAGFSATDLRDGGCHHIAWTREVGGVQDTVNGYQDAALIQKSRAGAQLIDASSTDDLWVGWSDFNAGKDIYQYQGLIKEIRIWNFAKTEVQIFNDRNKHLVGNETGLVAYWRANENFGDTAYDCTDNENHGQLQNGATWGTFCNNLDAIPSSCVPDTTSGPIDTTTGIITNNIVQEIRIYPNPANKLIYWSSSFQQQADINIYTLSQQRVIELKHQNSEEPIDISDLNAGIYFIEFTQENGHIVKRLVVE